MLRVVDLGRIFYEFKCKFLRSDIFNYTLYVMKQTLIVKTCVFVRFSLANLYLCIEWYLFGFTIFLFSSFFCCVFIDFNDYNTVRPNKKETRFISEISSLPRKIETNCMLHYQEHSLFFHLIPNT